MKILLTTFILLLSINAFSVVREDQVELTGKVYKFDSKIVYLKASTGELLLAPRSKVSNKKLRSRKEISIFLTKGEFFQMLTKKKLLMLKNKKRKSRRSKK